MHSILYISYLEIIRNSMSLKFNAFMCWFLPIVWFNLYKHNVSYPGRATDLIIIYMSYTYILNLVSGLKMRYSQRKWRGVTLVTIFFFPFMYSLEYIGFLWPLWSFIRKKHVNYEFWSSVLKFWLKFLEENLAFGVKFSY